MRAFGRDHSHRADKLCLSRLQGPRRTRLRDQRAEELAPGSSSSTVGQPLAVRQAFAVGWSCPPVPSLSWAMLNFAFTEFSEVRTTPVLHRAVFLCTGQGDIVIHT